MGISPTGAILKCPPPRDYSTLINLVKALPADVAGSNVDRLLSFLSFVPIDMSFHNQISAYDRLATAKDDAEFEKRILTITKKLSSICEQSKIIKREVDQMVAEGLGIQLNQSLRDFFIDDDSPLGDFASLQQALQAFAVSGRRSRRRLAKPNIAKGIVRAVCLYRHEEGLTGARFDWGPHTTKGGSGNGRYDIQPVPGTPVARLVAAVVDGLGCDIPNSTLKTELSKYGRLLKAEGRNPDYTDLAYKTFKAAHVQL